jgi:hypothetical protein
MQYADAAHFCPLFMDMMVVNTALWDALFAASGGAIPNAVAGASTGLLISGSNAGTTTLAALTITGATTHTGNVALADGLTIAAPSTTNRAGLDITGNGTGAALKLAAGATGKGVAITTTAGDGLSILPTAGDAIVATGNGTSKHGMRITGGTAGTSDGVSFIAGSGGVDVRGSITGNLSGSVGSVTGLTASNLDTTVSSRLAAASYTAPTNLTAAQIATGVWQDTTAGDFTAASSIGKSVMNGVSLGTGLTINAYTGDTPQTGDSFARLGLAGVGLTNLGDTRIANLDATVSSRTKPADTQARVTLVDTVTAVTGLTAANLDTTVSSRLAAASYTAPDNATIGTIDTKLGTPVVSVSADIAEVEAETDGIATLNNISAADVWAAATRILTAGTNIALAKGVGVTGFNDLSGADVRTAVGLASANLDTQLGTLATSASIAALNNISTSQVNAEVVDALATDTYGEPGQGAPAATTSLAAKLNYLFKAWRNKHTQTATEYDLYADDTTTIDQKASVSDNAVTFTRGEVASGP